MAATVYWRRIPTRLRIPAKTILREAGDEGLDSVLVLGHYPDGSGYAVWTDESDADINIMIDTFKTSLLKGAFDEQDDS